MQLFNLNADRGEQKNVADSNPGKVTELLELLQKQVENGRCTPGESVSNDRDVRYLPAAEKAGKKK